MRVFSRSARSATTGCASLTLRAGRAGRARTEPRTARPSRPASCCARAPRDDGGFTVEPVGRAASSCSATSRCAGCARPTSPTTRRSAISPTGWPGSASRRSWPSWAPSPAPRSPSATSRFDWEPTRGDGGDDDGPARWRRPARRSVPARPARSASSAELIALASTMTWPTTGRPRDRRRRRWTRRDDRAVMSRGAVAGRPPGGRQGRFVVADQPPAASTATGVDALVDALAERRAIRRRRSCSSPPARSPPASRRSGLTRRPRDLATQQAAASVGQGLLVAALHGRPSPGVTSAVGQVLLTGDDVVRRAHYRNARTHAWDGCSSSACRADRQRERHGRHRRDPVRRQRPARGAGRPPRRTPTCWCCSPTSTVSTTATRGAARPGCIDEVRGRRRPRRRRHRRDSAPRGLGTGGMSTKVDAAATRHLGRVSRPCSAPRPTARLRWPASTSAPCSTRPASDRAPGCSGSRTPPRPAGGCILDAGAVQAVVRAAAVAAARRHHRRRRATSPPAIRSSWSIRPVAWSRAGWSATTRPSCPPCSAARPRELGR